MADWRIHGHVMAKQRSSYGLHIVLFARQIEFNGFHRRNMPYLLVLCPPGALCTSLDSQLRVRDLVYVAGVSEPRTRPQSPILERDWDMILTEAHIPRFSNFCRRWWTRPPPGDPSGETDDAQSSSP
ncbi:MAG: hypothetical protein K2P70_08490 [Hyphomonadaceae bacterium]|nr:hypothetical protein [Hyphomonadaceae bacterium]